MVGWVLFRADSLGHARGYLGAMFGHAQAKNVLHPLGSYLTGDRLFCLGFAVVGATPVLPRLGRLLQRSRLPIAWHLPIDILRLTALFAVFLLACSQVANGTYNPFIYFRF